MTRSTLDPDTKEALRKTIRSLRERLLEDLHGATEREYRLSIPADKAALIDPQRTRRVRFEHWLDEQVRTVPAKDQKTARERFRRAAEKEAAYTLLHRLVLLRLMEAQGLSKPLVVTGGDKSAGYREFREYAPELCDIAGSGDGTEGYATLLELVYAERAVELPGLYGDVGLTRLVPVPPETLRAVVQALDAEALRGAWTDDTTLGWVYQFWNDPEREALDAKIADGRKIEPHEIASKTQMFTERYMVEWLLHNTLGQTWLAICEKNGWTADARAVLDDLDRRRGEWRAKREAGEVPLDALMPIHGELEERWKYWVPQPLLPDAVEKAPSSIRDLRLLDPACGSGHFLVIAFDLLAALHREEARHRFGERGGETWSDRAIAEHILEHNLHGVDIDPRCIQIAAAALWLKAKSLADDARPRALNLVAPSFRLGDLPKDDPALTVLLREVEREVGLPEALTRGLVHALAGADHLGTLLRVDRAIDEQIRRYVAEESLFTPRLAKRESDIPREALVEKLERFLDAHSAERDLGLRLEGEQLAAGVRFLRIVREGQYDIVVGNPPYQGLSKTERFGYVAKHYPRGKADLYAAFLERGLELVKEGGLSALLTMRGWMFLGQFAELRKALLHEHDLRAIGDFDRGAFDDVPNEVLAVSAPVFRRAPRRHDEPSVAVLPTPHDDKSYDRARTGRKRAAVLAQVGRHEFDPRGFEVIEGEPIVYWWTKDFLAKYAAIPKIGRLAPARTGMATQNNGRFLRRPWELQRDDVLAVRTNTPLNQRPHWVPYIKGAAGRRWLEPLEDVVAWRHDGWELRSWIEHYRVRIPGQYIKNEEYYFEIGVAFSPIGNEFSARAHRFASIFGAMGSSVFPESVEIWTCAMNSVQSRMVLESLNPGLHFEVGDVNRLPLFRVANAEQIFARIDAAFGEEESHREPSVEFRRPGPSPWRYAQDWAQRAVDRPEHSPLPPYEPEYDPPSPESFVSFAIGVALGRFGANGEGILSEAPPTALPHGILFVAPALTDSLDHPACAPLHAAWAEHGEGKELRDYLRKPFFDHHRKLYENRPIYFPLSSAKRSFVAYVSIHRWKDDTLAALLADHLLPAQRRLDGELADLRAAKASGDKKQARDAEKRYAEVQKQLEELAAFIAQVQHIAEKGAPPADAKGTPRERDAAFRMDLDDGVMINSAALWPLLEPQWKDPKKWWKELSAAEGKKDYDWSHLAARYWPTRVDAKCKEDPSLAVAHACFWQYHPAKAYAWELRLQHELDDPAFTIDEPASDAARQAFLANHPSEAAELRDKEHKRRARKAKGDEPESDERAAGDLFDTEEIENG